MYQTTDVPMIVTPEEWESRKRFVGFTEEDVHLLRELRHMANTQIDGIVEELYRRWLLFPELSSFFHSEAMIRRVKKAQRLYFMELTMGEYGEEYLASRLRVGLLHKQIGLEPRWYIGAYAIYAELVFPRVNEAFYPDFSRARRAFLSLLKIMMLDQELAITAYISGE